jgi:sphingomyelin phosphodiesterase 2
VTVASKSIRIATVNINGLPTFYHIKGAEEVLISHRVRHPAICDWFEQSDVDVICFQEVFTYRNVRLLRKGLPSYPYVAYKPFLFGPKGALVVFSKTPLKVTGYSSFLATAGQIRRAHLPMLNVLRSALKGILVVNLDSIGLTLINTHLVYSGNGQLDQAERFHAVHMAQLDELSSRVKNHLNDKPRLLVAGDLNVEVGAMTAEFIQKSNLHDLFAGDDSPSFHNEFLSDLKFKSRIDFLLTSDTASAETSRIFTDRVQLNGEKVFLSDHIRLVAKLTI